MRHAHIPAAALFLLIPISAGADRQTVAGHYAAMAAAPPSTARGQALWQRTGIQGRHCAQCHGQDLTRPARHQRTHKPIAPMAPSVNPKRLSDLKKVEKWFRRNCKWTWGRECTVQEKADMLQWLNTL